MWAHFLGTDVRCIIGEVVLGAGARVTNWGSSLSGRYLMPSAAEVTRKEKLEAVGWWEEVEEPVGAIHEDQGASC